jgi:hypothetical protein
MSESTDATVRFEGMVGVPLEAASDVGRLTSDGGLPWLGEADGTADPTHGDQEGTTYHGYYRQRMYHPLSIFDGDTDQLIAAVLRPGNAHGNRGWSR